MILLLYRYVAISRTGDLTGDDGTDHILSRNFIGFLDLIILQQPTSQFC